MKSTFTKALSLLLALVMVLSFAACSKDPAKTPDDPNAPSTAGEPATYTYRSYSSALGTNWNDHTWEMNADDLILGYVSSPFCTMSILDSENGVYQWVWEMATGITDVTAEHQDDLTKYNVTLQPGQTAETTTEGYVFEIALNPEARWENGEAINADNYIYSMKQLLNPEMKNYRANLYYAGENAVAGAYNYYFALTKGLYQAVAYADVEALLADGKEVYIDCHDFWGAAGYTDAAGNEAPQYVSINDETVYGEAQNDAFSGKMLFTDYGMYFEQGAADLFTYVDNANYNENYAETFDTSVGLYKVDDYTIRYVTQTRQDYNYFLTSCTSTWLVYEDLYEVAKTPPVPS